MQTITSHIETSTLIEECKLGNQQAQMSIYKRYYKMVFSSAYRIVQNKQDAEDLMQESFITCFGQLQNLKELDRFGGWLKRTAINKSINYVNRHKDKWLSLSENNVQVEQELDDEDELNEVKTKLIFEEIKNLPDGYRIILILYLIEGYDHEEIAEILKIKSSTSRSQYTRGRQKLKDILLTKYDKQFEK